MDNLASIIEQTPAKNPPSGRVAGVIAVIAVFGLLYDPLSHRFLNTEFGEQKSSLAVAIGVAITVTLALPLIGWRAWRWLILAFSASGSPMIHGQLSRYARNYRRAMARLHSEL